MYTVTLSVRSLFFVLALAGLALLPATASPEATYTVNTQDDYLPWLFPDPKISLRSALNRANSNPGTDEIILPAGTYTLTRTGSGDDTNSTGDLDILDSVTIIGAGPDKTIIDGQDLNDRVVHLPHDGHSQRFNVLISNLTIQNGKLTATDAYDGGGGIYNRQILTLNNVVVRNNSVAGAGGGGIQSDHELTLKNVVVRGNRVEEVGDVNSRVGGGIHNMGSLVVTDTLVSGNRADRGGGLFNAGLVSATIERSLFTENQAVSGSALLAYGTLELVNTTIHGNNFTLAGGVRCALLVHDTATVSFCTITDNLTNDAFESSGLCTSSTAQLTLRGNILAGNKRIGTPTNNNCTFFTPPTQRHLQPRRRQHLRLFDGHQPDQH